MSGKHCSKTGWLRGCRPALTLAAAVYLVGSHEARAQSTPAVQYYFSSSDTAYVPVTSETFAAGQTFTLAIYYTASGFTASSNSFNVMDIFVGFDQSNSYGTGATTLDNRLTLADGDNPNSAAITTDSVASGFSEISPGSGNILEGGQPTGQDGTLVRPFGVDIDLSLATGAPSKQDVTSPTHLLDVTFVNDNLAAGPETISIYNGGTGTDGTTYVDGSTLVRPNSTLFTAMQIGGSGGSMPEPSTLGLFAAGLLPLAGTLRRRRRQR